MKTLTRIKSKVLAAFLLVALSFNALAHASQNVYDSAICSTTFICAPNEEGVSMGSGVLIDAQRRLVVTNEHVVAGGERVIVFFPVIQQGQINCDQEYYLRHVVSNGVDISEVRWLVSKVTSQLEGGKPQITATQPSAPVGTAGGPVPSSTLMQLAGIPAGSK